MRVLPVFDHGLPLHSDHVLRTCAILTVQLVRGPSAAASDGLFAGHELWETLRNRGRAFVMSERNGSSNVSRYKPVYRRLIEGGGVEAPWSKASHARA